MNGEIRITVIATGFSGKESVLTKVRPLHTRGTLPPYLAESEVDIPAFIRRRGLRGDSQASASNG
jgi:hypothetical protein